MSKSIQISALPFRVECALTLPGSKSHANRAIVCAALTTGTTIIRGATPCDDVDVMVTNLKKMGFDIHWIDKKKGDLKIVGGIPSSNTATTKWSSLFCGNAGTTLRFLTSVCAITPGHWILTGDAHMKTRPIGDLVTALRSLGAEIEDTRGCPPLRIHGRKLEGGTVKLKADVSSQYLSSLLLIAPALKSGLDIQLEGQLASREYVKLTKKVIADFDRRPQAGTPAPNEFIFPKGAAVPGRGSREYTIEGDWSAAGAWLIVNALTKSEVTFTNLNEQSEQADRLLPDFIKKMSASGDLTLDCSSVPDQVMNLAVLAAYRRGKTTFTNIVNLRKKECDRLHVITTELKKAGVNIQERPDGIIVVGKQVTSNKQPVTLNPHDDHRMAMAFTILGLVRGGVTILNPECVKKSYPNFFDDVKIVEKSNRPIAIIGMRGAGKTSLCKKLASKLRLKALDSDKELQKEVGPLRAFVEKHSWPAFRKKEAETIVRILRPGIVLSCGGGATETAAVRALLKKHATVVWLKANESALIKRLQSEKRPRLTSLPLHEEVKKLVAERTPNYRDVATIDVPPNLRWNKQVPHIIQHLRD